MPTCTYITDHTNIDNGHQYQPTTSDPLLILSPFLWSIVDVQKTVSIFWKASTLALIDLWNFCLSNHPWQIYGYLFFLQAFGQWYICWVVFSVKMSSRNRTTMITTTKRTKVVEEEPNNCNNQQQMATTATKLRGYLQVKQNPTTRRSRLPRKVHNTNNMLLHTGFI